MKYIIKKMSVSVCAVLLLASCKKFSDINVNPIAADSSQVQVEYFINNSIVGAQMDPDVAERSFVLYWKPAGRQASDWDGGAINVGSYNDGWSTNYYNQLSGWLNNANTAIQIGESKIAAGTAKSYTPNLIQVARIWRAYLMSEFSDNFGPMPVDAFKGTNPQFNDVKTVYYYMLAELKDAASKLDLSVNSSDIAKQDPAYGYNYTQWKKYATSMRLRLAMRLSEVDAGKAKTEFEDACADVNNLITSLDDNFQVQEKDGWSPLTGVMTRSWDTQPLSVTLRNMYLGLGGVKSADQLGAAFQSAIKPANWLGQRYLDHFPVKNNDPVTGYWLDGLPYSIDPRAYKAFSIPGDVNNPNYPKQNGDFDVISTRNLKTSKGDKLKSVDAKYTWNARIDGDFGPKDPMNELFNYGGTMPRINMQFRNSTQKRIFFAAWETYFLLAEASVRGWTTPVNGKTAYEKGITLSFNYWDNGVVAPGTAAISPFVTAYLASADYNNCGTSVSWDHTTEPPASRSMQFEDGYTGTPGSASIVYPANTLYKSGTVKNDRLTKIITQKFIAQCPWLPLETWNDHRRLGLPFFENPTIELPISTLPALTDGTYMTSNVKFFPQRLKYPSVLSNSSPEGYQQAKDALGSDDAVLTPLWWAKQQ
ncbi:SusD/RagB family nutrient-binding outer membrane lipoprotein [Niabella pedocola]|uniref:SusD/RagB family nutrient-binding outer membrane lipoprotein n=1 Tax=Niabella pedocola TaxID=1752077 RepID=A0ABS8PT01_9BACT|nr:SusD/RagB family nutrient-binding outer membrane lipoprotein [Niabella pedocola]MCD2423949.1 SusD/RagB family nutrient-binding outer membrane lipoprotein [Niabella pedocola]